MPDPLTASDTVPPDADGSPGSSHAEQLFALLYSELHELARVRLQQAGELTLLDTTALLHESFLRLRGAAPRSFPDQHRFLAYAAKAMRSVVLDLVRSRQAERHGGGLDRLTWHTDLAAEAHPEPAEVLRVNEALEELARLEPRLATVVELRYFGGLSDAEIAAVLDLKLRTVQRDWSKARLFLSMRLRG